MDQRQRENGAEEPRLSWSERLLRSIADNVQVAELEHSADADTWGVVDGVYYETGVLRRPQTPEVTVGLGTDSDGNRIETLEDRQTSSSEEEAVQRPESDGSAYADDERSPPTSAQVESTDQDDEWGTPPQSPRNKSGDWEIFYLAEDEEIPHGSWELSVRHTDNRRVFIRPKVNKDFPVEPETEMPRASSVENLPEIPQNSSFDKVLLVSPVSPEENVPEILDTSSNMDIPLRPSSPNPSENLPETSDSSLTMIISPRPSSPISSEDNLLKTRDSSVIVVIPPRPSTSSGASLSVTDQDCSLDKVDYLPHSEEGRLDRFMDMDESSWNRFMAPSESQVRLAESSSYVLTIGPQIPGWMNSDGTIRFKKRRPQTKSYNERKKLRKRAKSKSNAPPETPERPRAWWNLWGLFRRKSSRNPVEAPEPLAENGETGPVKPEKAKRYGVVVLYRNDNPSPCSSSGLLTLLSPPETALDKTQGSSEKSGVKTEEVPTTSKRPPLPFYWTFPLESEVPKPTGPAKSSEPPPAVEETVPSESEVPITTGTPKTSEPPPLATEESLPLENEVQIPTGPGKSSEPPLVEESLPLENEVPITAGTSKTSVPAPPPESLSLESEVPNQPGTSEASGQQPRPTPGCMGRIGRRVRKKWNKVFGRRNPVETPRDIGEQDDSEKNCQMDE